MVERKTARFSHSRRPPVYTSSPSRVHAALGWYFLSRYSPYLITPSSMCFGFSLLLAWSSCFFKYYGFFCLLSDIGWWCAGLGFFLLYTLLHTPYSIHMPERRVRRERGNTVCIGRGAAFLVLLSSPNPASRW